MRDDTYHGIQPDRAAPDHFMAVFMAAHRIFRIVDMNGFETLKPQNAVKLFQNAIQIGNYIVTGIKDMTGIQANAEPVPLLHAIDHRAQFFKRASDFRTFPGHGFKQNRCGKRRFKQAVEMLGYFFDSDFRPLLHMAAGMEIIQASRQILEPAQIVLHRFERIAAKAFIGRAGIERIRCMRQKRPKMMLAGKFGQCRDVFGIKRFHTAAPRTARKKLKGIGSDGQSGFPHGQIPF